jgi:hypothetical protein
MMIRFLQLYGMKVQQIADFFTDCQALGRIVAPQRVSVEIAMSVTSPLTPISCTLLRYDCHTFRDKDADHSISDQRIGRGHR